MIRYSVIIGMAPTCSCDLCNEEMHEFEWSQPEIPMASFERSDNHAILVCQNCMTSIVRHMESLIKNDKGESQ